jgi:hypothetical protein
MREDLDRKSPDIDPPDDFSVRSLAQLALLAEPGLAVELIREYEIIDTAASDPILVRVTSNAINEADQLKELTMPRSLLEPHGLLAEHMLFVLQVCFPLYGDKEKGFTRIIPIDGPY